MLLGVGAMVAGARGRARQRHRPGRRRRDHGAAGIDPPLAALLSAQPGGTGRPRRREVPQRDRPVGQGHVRDLQALRRSDRCSRRAAPTPTRSRIRCRRSASRRSQEIARTSPYWDKKDPPELQLRHDMMRAKIYGFMERRGTVLRRYPPSDTSLPARYARAISTYRHADLRNAVAQIDALIQTQPNNPYFHELKGQALLEGGRAAEAIAPLRRAVQLAPRSRADPDHARAGAGRHQRPEASPTKRSRSCAPRWCASPESPDGYHPARHGLWPQGRPRPGRSRLRAGRVRCAATSRPRASLPTRAKTRFPIGSPGWVKADDIVSVKLPAAKRISEHLAERNWIGIECAKGSPP